MHDDTTTRPSAVTIRDGVMFLNGYGISVSVDARHLCVSDGVGRQRGFAKFAKATSRLKRLVVMGQTGFVTLPALKWLSDIGAAFAQIDYTGRVIAMSIQGLDNAMMRRAQAFATVGESRSELAAALLLPKVEAQAQVLDTFSLASEKGELPRARGKGAAFDEILQSERQAALCYWNSWTGVSMDFARRDAVPAHWRKFDTRRSPLTSQPRNAATPINALLNYLYTLLEIEARIALLLRGLDPGLGLFHADAANRQSLAADVMEPVRPHVDAFVLKTLRSRVFRAKDFVETREGGCRLTGDIARELAGTMPTWARLVAPFAELVTRHVIAYSKTAYVGPQVQDRAQKRSVHKGRLRVRTERITLPTVSEPVALVRNACRECGLVLPDADRRFCDDCLPQVRREHFNESLGSSEAGRAALARLRAEGNDPLSKPDVRKRRAAKASKNRRAVMAWNDDGSLDGIDFARDVLTRLQAVPTNELRKALQCSESYACRIKYGKHVPHRRHWCTLLELGRKYGG